MTSERSGPGNEDSDEALERSLESMLRRQPLSDDAFLRMRSAVEAEWRAVTPASARWSRTRLVGLAAGILVLVGMAVTWLRPEIAPAVLGSVARVQAPGLENESIPFLQRAVNSGDALRAGETIEAHGPALVVLERGGTLRMARGAVIKVIAANAIELAHGQIYVDLTPGQPRATAFVVRTSLGIIEHLGTQFEVTTVARDIRIRVREGRVRLRTNSGAELADAGTELLVSHAGGVSRALVPTYGPAWSWVEALIPEYEIENRQLIDFLRWVARESGRRLEIADERASVVAERTRLHGSVHGRRPLEALADIMSTTSLHFELGDDSIRVGSEP
jgi:ferric-dicitrate binding protein FerR (iron transport regulator)